MNLLKDLANSLFLVAFLLTSGAANAEEGGAKDNLHKKLEPIVVNVLGPTRQYVQVELVLKFATPDIDEKIKSYMPVIRHKIILLLSGMNAHQLGSSEGKQKLVQESKSAINQTLGLTEKQGVTEVLFDSFIIQ